MKIHLIAFGKLKTPGLLEANHYYMRNLTPWLNIDVHELKPIRIESKTKTNRARVQEKEEELLKLKLSSLLSPRGQYYLLDETGKSMKTEAWAQWLKTIKMNSIPEIALCVGGSLGFSKKTKENASGIFNLGPQTLSHEIARLVLTEQLYRMESVLRNHPYHNQSE